MNESCQGSKVSKEYKIHSFYILLILISVIIILTTVKWAKIPQLVEYLTFALTVSSLMLATLAIIYSIYSNSSISNLLGEISSSSKEIRSSAQNISESNRKLSQEIGKLPKRLDSVDAGIAETREFIKEYAGPKNIDEQPLTMGKPEDSSASIQDELVKSFLEKSSISGLEVILMAVLSYKTSTAFKFDDISYSDDGVKSDNSYLYGYFVASSALGIISHSIDAQERFLIKYVHPSVTENIEKVIRKNISDVAESYVKEFEKGREEALEKWTKSTKEIYEFFGVKFEPIQ